MADNTVTRIDKQGNEVEVEIGIDGVNPVSMSNPPKNSQPPAFAREAEDASTPESTPESSDDSSKSDGSDTAAKSDDSTDAKSSDTTTKKTTKKSSSN